MCQCVSDAGWSKDTSGDDFDLLCSTVVQDGASFEYLEVVVTTALISALPALSSLISNGVAALPGAAETSGKLHFEENNWLSGMIVEILAAIQERRNALFILETLMGYTKYHDGW